MDYKIIRYKKLISTNIKAKELALKGKKEGTVVVSEEQTGGKGRLGRKWHSGNGCGIYMSVILDLNNTKNIQLVTLACGCAVFDALTSYVPGKIKIKWPNDILILDRKVCGILVEGVIESGKRTVVAGIGINIKKPRGGWPSDIKEKATSLEEHVCCTEIDKNDIINEVLFYINKYITALKEDKTGLVIKTVRNNSATIGKNVTIVINQNEVCGTAVDIDEDGKLKVKAENRTYNVLSGEVKVN